MPPKKEGRRRYKSWRALDACTLKFAEKVSESLMDDADVVEPEKRRRRHFEPIDPARVEKSFNKYFRSQTERFERKAACFPDGEYLLVFRCTGKTRRGISELKHRMSGTPWMVKAAESALDWNALEQQFKHPTAARLGPAADDDNDLRRRVEYMICPNNAEKRAEKTRRLLREAWEIFVENTPFRGTKQMYNVVKKHPEMKFPWWSAVVGDTPFVNTAVDDPETSRKLFEYLGPRLYHRTFDAHDPPSEPDIPLEPHERCQKDPHCKNKAGHRGKCSIPVEFKAPKKKAVVRRYPPSDAPVSDGQKMLRLDDDTVVSVVVQQKQQRPPQKRKPPPTLSQAAILRKAAMQGRQSKSVKIRE